MKAILRYQRPLSLFLAFVVALGTFNCYSRKQIHATKLNEINIEKSQFVVIDPTAPKTIMWRLSNVKIADTAFTAQINQAPPEFVKKIASINSNKEMGANQDIILLYVNPAVVRTYSNGLDTRLEFKDITKIEAFQHDGGKVVLLVLAGIVVVGGVVYIISCNCPYVYTQSPQGAQHLEGALFAGAIYPQLERHDWLLLTHLTDIDNQYQITLANRLHENQHTNFVALEVLDHAQGIRPLYDKYGHIHTLAAPQMPVTATDISGMDVRAEVLAEDDRVFRGNVKNGSPEVIEQLNLVFVKPSGAKQAKLIVNAKNNVWLDYVYYQFQDELGVYADKARRKYLKKPASENLAWAERQKIPLAVWLETAPGQWKKADYFNIAGSTAFRNDVLSLDLSELKGDSVHLRLEYGFNFWEIDYAALDFSPDVPVKRQTLHPISAVTQSGEDVTATLTADDARYYDQPNVGDEAKIIFHASPLLPGHSRSLILHSKGHYEILHEQAPGRPGFFQLKSWEKENALPRLSRDRWMEAMQTNLNR